MPPPARDRDAATQEAALRYWLGTVQGDELETTAAQRRLRQALVASPAGQSSFAPEEHWRAACHNRHIGPRWLLDFGLAAYAQDCHDATWDALELLAILLPEFMLTDPGLAQHALLTFADPRFPVGGPDDLYVATGLVWVVLVDEVLCYLDMCFPGDLAHLRGQESMDMPGLDLGLAKALWGQVMASGARVPQLERHIADGLLTSKWSALWPQLASANVALAASPLALEPLRDWLGQECAARGVPYVPGQLEWVLTAVLPHGPLGDGLCVLVDATAPRPVTLPDAAPRAHERGQVPQSRSRPATDSRVVLRRYAGRCDWIDAGHGGRV